MQTNTFMNSTSFTRFASFLLAIGFFFACSSSAPTISSLIEQNNYEDALQQINTSLEGNPDQPLLYIQKGEIHTLLAAGKSASERTSHYTTARTSFDKALELGVNDEQAQKITEIVTSKWEQEFNTGTDVYEDEDAPDRFQTSIAHFENATILDPDETDPYLSLSVALYNLNQVNEAISVLNIAKNRLDNVPAEIYEYLGFLYRQNGEPDQAVFYYELANTNIAENKNIAFGLVNAYISGGQTEKAADLLGDLKSNYPYDARIHNVYGTQLFLITEGIMNDLIRAYETNDTGLLSQLKFEVEGMAEQAENELIEAYTLEDTNIDYVESLAVFYNNLTSKYLEVHAVADEADKAVFKAKASSLIDLAIEYYERLLTMHANDTDATSVLEQLRQIKDLLFPD